MIEAEGVSYCPVLNGIPFPVVDEVSFALRKGEITALLGPNGCGKTTLIRLLAGLLRATNGSIRKDITCRSTGLVFQDVKTNLLPWLDVTKNVALPAIIKGVGDYTAKEQAALALKRLDLIWTSSRLPSQLSGGQQQLVSLARWIANPPDLLLIDEGWSMLDILQRERIYLILRELSSSSAIGIVTHSMSDLAALVDNVIIFGPRPANIRQRLQFSVGQPFRERSELLWESLRAVFGEHLRA